MYIIDIPYKVLKNDIHIVTELFISVETDRKELSFYGRGLIKDEDGRSLLKMAMIYNGCKGENRKRDGENVSCGYKFESTGW